MIDVVPVRVMKESDALTIERGVSGIELMGRAAKGIFDAVGNFGRTAIVCGGGNNGGDGYALALILKENGCYCEVYRVSDKLTPESRHYYDLCLKKGIRVADFTMDTAFDGFDTVVDCIFGTGFRGAPKGLEAAAIEAVNKSRYIVSADINSGLNGDNGLAELAVKSDITVSIGCYKCGHFLNMAKDYIGKLVNADIGITLSAPPYKLAEVKDFKSIFKKRPNFSHKGTYGKTVIIGGSIKYSGAVKLAAMADAAVRSGSGLTVLAVPETVAHGILPYVLEPTLCPLPEEGGFIKFDQRALGSAVSGAASVCFGMGLGDGKDNQKILEYLLENVEGSLVIDADGLNTLEKADKNVLKTAKPAVILTPHIKEFSRLTGLTVNEIAENPIEISKAFAAEYNVTVLLKGAATVVTDGKKVYIIQEGTPGMSKGGSGDVLSGIIGGINAFSNEPPLLNAAAGAFINGRAGELACAAINEYSMTPSDTVKHIAEAVSGIIFS